jgi:hypothetical protein
MTARESKPDVPLEAPEIAGLLLAYRAARSLQSDAQREVDKWQEVADSLKGQITPVLTPGGHNVVTVGGKPVARWSRWTQNQFDVTKFKEKEPERYAQYLTSGARDRLTVSDLLGK